MKFILFSLFLLCFSWAVQAQNTDTLAAKPQFYAGVGVSSMQYQIYYKSDNPAGAITSNNFRPVLLNLGYALSERATLQVGLAYGSDKETSEWVVGTGQTDKQEDSKTRAMAVPVTLRLLVGNSPARLSVYATLTLMPT